MDTPSPPRVAVRYPHRRALLSSARAEGESLTLFAPSVLWRKPGTDVLLEITFGDSPLRFEVVARVRAVFTAQVGARQEPGLGVGFFGAHKPAAAQMLAVCAGRALDDGTALDSRRPVEVSCRVNFATGSLRAFVRDVSNTGAFIGAPQLGGVRPNTELTIQLEPLFGRWGGHLLKARVIWTGEKKGVRGFGVRFSDATTHVREGLKKHFARSAP